MFDTLDTLNVFIGVLWLFSFVIDYVDFLYLWQLKEYRVDRMRDFFSTPRGHQFWRSYPIAMRAIIAIGAFVFLREIWPVQLVVLCIFAVDSLYNIRAILRKTVRRPKFTKKILAIMLVGGLVECFFIVQTQLWPIVIMLLAFRFLLLSFIVVAFEYPTVFLKRLYIYRARKKLAMYSDLTVVGITGSYGKTSVKTFLAHVLSTKFSVVHTPKNINTEIGIAKFILSQNFSGKDVFVVEMGAYRIGEIKQICDMVHPKIGVLTAINEQHLSLFGSIEKTQQAKYELLRSLPKDGLAISDSDCHYCRAFLPELQTPVQCFGYDGEYAPQFQILETKSKGESLFFRARWQGQEYSFQAPIAGEHNADNLAAVVIVANYLGMSHEDIVASFSTLTPPDKTMQLFTYGSCTIIDDSYNANPHGFRAALAYMSSFSSKRKRIVVTRGMLELADKSDAIHQRIAEEIAFCADELIIISPDYEKPLRAGIHKKYRTDVKTIVDHKALLAYFKSIKDKDCVVLLENKIPSSVYTAITSSMT